jgi:hypothetical protein
MTAFVPVPKKFTTTPSYESPAYVSGLNQTVLDETRFSISSGCCRDVTTDTRIVFDGVSVGSNGFITVDVSTVGSNGCYPWALDKLTYVRNTIFPVYIISAPSGTGPANPAVIVATGDDFLPPDYTAYCRIGFINIYFDPSDGPLYTISKWSQSGDSSRKVYQSQRSVSPISGAINGTFTQIDMTSVNRFVPPKDNVEIMFTVQYQPSDVSSKIMFSRDGIDSPPSPIPRFSAIWDNPTNTAANGGTLSMISGYTSSSGISGLPASVIYVKTDVNTAVIQLNLTGFVDELGFSYY